MTKALIVPGKKAQDKQVSLTVAPLEPGSSEIRVDITRKLSKKTRNSQKRFAGFLFLVMLLLLFPMVRDVYSYLKMNEEYQVLQEYNQELRRAIRDLEEENSSLYSFEIIERIAREDLDMVFPGESKVYNAIPTNDIPRRDNLRASEALH